MVKKVKTRSLRHWKQRFNKNAKFVWRRSIVYAGIQTVVGKSIPKILADSPTKLRRFWESSVIELAEFEAPNVLTGQRLKPLTKAEKKKAETEKVKANKALLNEAEVNPRAAALKKYGLD